MNWYSNRPFNLTSLGLSFFAGLGVALFVVMLWKQHSPDTSQQIASEIAPHSQSSNSQDDYLAEGSDDSKSNFSKSSEIALEVSDENDRTGAIPLEWEKPLFAILDQENMDLRNKGLIQLATVTAKHVPRVQAECLAHLTYSLGESDYKDYLSLARNDSLPIQSRVLFLEQTFEIRPPEFSLWLAQNLAKDTQGNIASLAKQFLIDYQTKALTEKQESSSFF
jgi:hypothetical protein